MKAVPISFERHLDSDLSQGLAGIRQWRPSPKLAVPLGPPVMSSEHYLATLALGPGRRRAVRLVVSRWSETRGTHVVLVPLHRVRSTRRYLGRSRALLSDVLTAIDRGLDRPGPPQESEVQLRRSA